MHSNVRKRSYTSDYCWPRYCAEHNYFQVAINGALTRDPETFPIRAFVFPALLPFGGMHAVKVPCNSGSLHPSPRLSVVAGRFWKIGTFPHFNPCKISTFYGSTLQPCGFSAGIVYSLYISNALRIARCCRSGNSIAREEFQWVSSILSMEI